MTRFLALFSVAALGVAGCSSFPAPVRFVPSSTVYRVEPQPVSFGEFQDAERQGYQVAATGRGLALGADDLPVELTEGERLHVLRVMPDTDEVLVRRLDYHAVARVSSDALELRGTTYPEKP